MRKMLNMILTVQTGTEIIYKNMPKTVYVLKTKILHLKGFCFNTRQITYTPVKSPFFKVFDEPSLVTG